MPRISFINLLASIAIMMSITNIASAAPVPPTAIAEAQLRAINHRFVNAFSVADTEFMDALTANDFFMIGNNGSWIDRTGHLEAMKKPSVTGGLSYDDVRVRLFGTVALVHGVFEALAADGSPRRVRYTDVYHWSGSKWLLVSAQNTPLREGVAKYLHQGTTPSFTRWQRVDPVGNDLDVLRELNENYVRAFREADVAWYDAHLSPDYVVINGDGSFNDRAKALENFAKPTFATSMKSFPVGDVRRRRFDDIAIIHAENAYELKDGRKGVSRYTDIWHKQSDGRWKCIAAHITTYKAPA
jgi:ketosteroid isomerase-like protein